MDDNKVTMDDYMEEINKSFRKIKEGDMLQGVVVDVNDDGIVLDLRYYAPGFIPAALVSDDPDYYYKDSIHIGDELDGVVVEVDDGTGNIKLSLKEANNILAWEKLRYMLGEEQIQSIKVKEAVNGGVVAYVLGIRGFIPASQLDVVYVDNLEDYVGRKLDVRVITVDENQSKLILSSKAVVKERLEKENMNKLSMVVPGSVFEGVVESLMPYGAFVLLDNGLTGLVHISKICNKRIKKPSEVLKLSQRVKVKVVEIKDGKLSLSMREFDDSSEDPEVDEIESFDYKCDGEATTNLGSIFANIKL